jgi:hypothetical protein
MAESNIKQSILIKYFVKWYHITRKRFKNTDLIRLYCQSRFEIRLCLSIQFKIVHTHMKNYNLDQNLPCRVWINVVDYVIRKSKSQIMHNWDILENIIYNGHSGTKQRYWLQYIRRAWYECVRHLGANRMSTIVLCEHKKSSKCWLSLTGSCPFDHRDVENTK